MKSSLPFITTVEVPALPHFDTRDHFKVNVSDTALVKIAFISNTFTDNLLDKIEEPVGSAVLAVRNLRKRFLDKDIRAKLGENKEETTLSQIWALLKVQGRGEVKGPLLTNGYANIFYVRNTRSTPWAMFVRWGNCDNSWSVGAYSVSYPFRWNEGDQVFCLHEVNN